MKKPKPERATLIRHFVQSLPAPVADGLRSMKRSVLNVRGRRRVFEQIADDNTWGGTESVSGPGSTMETTTAIRAALPGLLEKYDVKVFLDIPCGDAYWITQVLPEGIDYIGADIVPKLVEGNLVKNLPNCQFVVLDIVSDCLPRADMVIVRDCFIHLPNRMVREAIANVKRSGTRYLLTTTYPDHADNIDIEIGGFRPIDLQKPPFGLPAPKEIFLETEGATSGKSIALWDLSAL